MTTVANAIDLTARELYGTQRSRLNQLNGAITSTAEVLTLSRSTSGIAEGTVLGIEDELIYVWDVDKSSLVAQIQRAVEGTTAATHADNTLIEVSPRYARATIRQALLEEIQSWPVSVYAVSTQDVSFGASDRAVDFTGVDPDLFLRVLYARAQPTSTGALIDDGWPDVPSFHVNRNANATTFPTTLGAFVDTAFGIATTVRVTYAHKFDLSVFTDAINLETVCGIPARAHDIPRLGAQARLSMPRELRRLDLDAQSEKRDSAEVPAGSRLSVARGLFMQRDARLRRESETLAFLYGWASGA